MKLTSAYLVVLFLVAAAVSSAQVDSWNRRRPPQCTPEPITMVGLGVAGLGLLRAKFKKSA